MKQNSLNFTADETLENAIKKDSAHFEKKICHKKQSWEEQLQTVTEMSEFYKKEAKLLREAGLMLPSRGDWSAAGFVLLLTASVNAPAKSRGDQYISVQRNNQTIYA